jgi:hypothetical protein
MIQAGEAVIDVKNQAVQSLLDTIDDWVRAISFESSSSPHRRV